MAKTTKRGYSREFTVTATDAHGRYLLDRIPATLWRQVRARARREGVSVRALLLGALTTWIAAPPPPPHEILTDGNDDMRTTINHGPFQRAHGKSPRGRGHWAFCPASRWERDDYLDFVFWHDGTYRDAAAAARVHFARLGIDAIVVCS